MFQIFLSHVSQSLAWNETKMFIKVHLKKKLKCRGQENVDNSIFFDRTEKNDIESRQSSLLQQYFCF